MPLSSPNDPAAFRRLLTRNIALPLVLGLASAAAFVGLIFYLLAAIGEVERTDQVLSRASLVQKLDLDMESGLRGFLLNGDMRFLPPLERAREGLIAEVPKLRQGVASDPAQLE